MSQLAFPLKTPVLPQVPRTPPLGGLSVAGLIVVAIFFAGFGLWAALAPLSSAAVAPGVVRVESNRKTVQHLEGGIIAQLRVREGDVVARNQVLIVLDRTQAEAHAEALRNEHRSLRAAEARLIAERDGAEHIAFPDELLKRRDDSRVAEILTGQERIFDTRRRNYERQTSILAQRVGQLHSQIEGFEGQIASEDRQLELIGQETADVQGLVGKGLERRARLLSLQRETALQEGRRAEHRALIAQAEQAIGETELQILNLMDQLSADVAGELKDTQGRLVEVEEELRAAEDVLRRCEIRAPIDGTVVGLRFFTPGGVIEPGVPILDIVPQADRLIVEARVNPLDIDVVEPGLPAQVRLTAFKQRNTPTLKGRVIHVSADSLVDEQADTATYKALVAIEPQELRRLETASLYPGMPAEVLIVTGERTLWDYMVTPVRDSFIRAFREE